MNDLEILTKALQEELEDEKKFFCRKAAILFQTHHMDCSAEFCWNQAEKLWNKKPKHL